MRYLVLLFFPICCALAALVWHERAPLPLPRTGYAAGEVSGKLLIAGGSYWVNDQKLRTARTDCFNPQSNQWHECPSLPLPLSDLTSVTIGGVIYAIGGTEGKAARRSVYRFTNGQWEEWQYSLPEPRMNAAAATDGRFLYVTGGLAVLNDYGSASAKVWRIDTSAEAPTWEQLPDIPGDGRFVHAAVWVNQKLYVFGGCMASGDTVKNFAEVYRFDPASRSWSQAPDLPSARRALYAAADGDDVLLLGGVSDRVLNEVWRFRPSDGSYHAEQPLAEAIADAKFIRIGSRWLMTGGEPRGRVRSESTWEGTERNGED